MRRSRGRPVDTHTEEDIDAEAGRVAALLKRMRPPPGPITERWALGIGDIVADTAHLPKWLRGAVSFLNRFGGLAISPATLEFDGDDVNWSKMTEIDTRTSSNICSPARWKNRRTGCPCRGFPAGPGCSASPRRRC